MISCWSGEQYKHCNVPDKVLYDLVFGDLWFSQAPSPSLPTREQPRLCTSASRHSHILFLLTVALFPTLFKEGTADPISLDEGPLLSALRQPTVTLPPHSPLDCGLRRRTEPGSFPAVPRHLAQSPKQAGSL